ncbi:luciferase family protein [Natrinema pellirubrum DSM 15624]|uniref:F420-dependent oxidoreductase, MSMEG_2256 family n=1 Tax=Natrinema pellirubrum (strain DSM 15624 / CIP 106293 / JCM 10476 / NCIMB 786 / 157) TaxID=797303 RepID=L0JRV4_NATP1|nr:TIGR03617 family F420-dependent LLM class oxidoreductase [Natrinema pellirubrum]AGB33337.1 putative F420-dependent oxidoreductase, MSMEG_2256 family [Natrinema pellirubrum DSM 15624]ELY71461.1 luciferase family protein [Natrinema pellirubrum DSM 15624]
MSDLRIDAMVPKLANDSGEAAARAEELGFDGVWTPEMDNDAFLPHPVIADRTEEIQQGTRIALSFTRSPMALAYTAWDLAQYTDGRFVLGLGTQVKGHNERRFSVDWESPGPRLREVVESLRHIFDVFQGEADLDYEGDHYSFSLMTDNFNPGPIDHPDVPIYIAGVNEYNIRLAGELCDGLDMHVFNTPGYTDDVIAPTVAEGADRGERSLEDVSLSASPFVVTGETEDERERSRREVRRRIAFYGSTRTYHDVLEHHGWKSVGEELHELSKDGEWEEMADLVTDEMVSTFAIEAPPEELLAEAEAVYGGIADRVVLPLDHGEAFLNE